MMVVIGRTTREEEDTQGPGEEAHHIHPPLRECHHDWWQEEDESQPDFVRLRFQEGSEEWNGEVVD
jgi:hypothetical protein